MCGFVGPAETWFGTTVLHESWKLTFTIHMSNQLKSIRYFTFYFYLFCQLENHLHILNKQMKR